MKRKEVKQHVLLNPSNFELGLGIKIQYFDNTGADDPLVTTQGYSIIMRESNSYDGWLVTSGKDQPWVGVPKDMVDGKLEIVGEL